MDESTRESLSDSKRRLIERLKRSETATAPELAAEFGLTDTAVRQHLEALEHLGLVTRAADTSHHSTAQPVGRGRPPVRWRLGTVAGALFPDRHGELTVEIIESIRDAFGDDGVDAVVAARTRRQQDSYCQSLGAPTAAVGVRVHQLAEIRTAEGYLAEVTSDGLGFVLTEHHCPIGDAASACRGLCSGELELFRDVLGDAATVERTSHLLSGDSDTAPMAVLYGALFFEKRTSLYGRKIWNGPNSPSTAASSDSIGPRTDASYRALLACQNTLELSASSAA